MRKDRSGKEYRTGAQLLRRKWAAGKVYCKGTSGKTDIPRSLGLASSCSYAGESPRIGLHPSKAHGTFWGEGSDSRVGVFCVLRSSL